MPMPRLPKLNVCPPWVEPLGQSVVRLARPLLAASLLVTGATLGIRQLGWLEFVELSAYDHVMQQQPDLGPDNRLLVVGITETDLQTLQEWPVSDRSLAQALVELQRHEPAVIAVDILRDFPQEPGHAELIRQFRQHPTILATCKTSSLDDLGTPPPTEVVADQVGFADLVIDPGGILRRSLLLVTPPQPATPFPKHHHCNNPTQTLLSLGFRSTLLYLQSQGIEAGFTEAGELRLGNQVIPKIGPNTGGYRNADTAGYQVLLHYRSESNAAPQVSLLDVIEGRVGPELVRDRIVMLGYTTPQSKDDFYTPFSSSRGDKQKMPGVVVHAQSASQLLSTVFDGQPLLWVWPKSVELLWIVGWSVVGGLLGWYLRHPAAFALVIVLGAGGLYATSLVLFRQGGWIPVVPPAITFMGTAVGVVLLDRFSNSAYGQQVYRTVKTLLHLDIEIDEEKLEKQVAEITESDYFRDLQDKVKLLRDGGSIDDGVNQAVPGWSHGVAVADDGPTLDPDLDSLNWLLAPETPSSAPREPVAAKAPPPSPAAADDGLSFLSDLSQTVPTVKERPGDTAAAPEDNRSGFLGDLSRETEQLRHLKAELPASPAPLAASEDDGWGFLNDLNREARQFKQHLQAEAPVYSPFGLDGAFCRCGDTSEATVAYVAFIDQEIKKLKQSIRDHS